MQEAYDLVIKNGMLVTGQGMKRADLGVRGERIAAVEECLPAEGAKRVIDAKGKFVFPGIVDVHVHPVYVDDVEHSSRVAAYGGVTTLLHFAYARQGRRDWDHCELMATG